MNINQLQRYAVKEYLLMKFIFMGVIAEYLINVHVDNLGSIFISEERLTELLKKLSNRPFH